MTGSISGKHNLGQNYLKALFPPSIAIHMISSSTIALNMMLLLWL
jgi:hypothetical protein